MRRLETPFDASFSEVSRIAQIAFKERITLAHMSSEIEIVHVEKEEPDGLIVTFSDGTVGAYVVEELLELRPHREPIETID